MEAVLEPLQWRAECRDAPTLSANGSVSWRADGGRASAALENVAVVVVDEDPDEPDLFGLSQSDPYLPDTITICRLPLVRAFPDRRELERQIRITVLHELGHYFGMDEGDLDELGYG